MVRKYFTRSAPGTWIVLMGCGVSVLISALAVQHSHSAHSGVLAAMLLAMAVLMEVLAVVQWRVEGTRRGE